MDDLTQWQLVPGDRAIATPLRRPGKFDVRQVADAEGFCADPASRPGTVLRSFTA